MAASMTPRLERWCARLAAGLWLLGLAGLWVLVEPTPRAVAAALLASYFLGWGVALVLARPPRVGMIARFVLVSVALGGSLTSLELAGAVGLVDFHKLLSAEGPSPRENPDNLAEPDLIHRHRPYLKRSGTTRGDLASAFHLVDSTLHRFDVAYDRNGFRNPRNLTSAEVVVLGDSFVEGGLVAADDVFTTVLARRLGRDVANLGQSGYGPQQELAVLKRFGTPLKPRLCIWTFYEGNDLDDVARYEAETRSGDARTRPAGKSRLERSLTWNVSRTLACELGRAVDPHAADRAPWGTFRDTQGQTIRLYFNTPGGSVTATQENAFKNVVATLNEARNLCIANQVPLLVIFAPAKFRIYQKSCTFSCENPCAQWRCDNLPERLTTEVSRMGPGIDFLDLTPTLKEEAGSGRLVYFSDDTHWSALGHEAVARALADVITSRDALRLRTAANPGCTPDVSIDLVSAKRLYSRQR